MFSVSMCVWCDFTVVAHKLWTRAQGDGGSIKRGIYWILKKVNFYSWLYYFVSCQKCVTDDLKPYSNCMSAQIFMTEKAVDSLEEFQSTEV